MKTTEILMKTSTSNLMLIDSVVSCAKKGDFQSVEEVVTELLEENRKLSELNSYLLNRGN